MPRRPLTEAEAGYLSERKLGRLATASRSGMPHAVPVGYAYVDGIVWISSDPGDLKLDNIEANPFAALVVDEPPPAKSGVLVRGRARLHREGETFERAQDHLIAAGAHSRRRKQPGEQIYITIEPVLVSSWRMDV